MLHRWMQQENISKLPAKFSDYLEFIVRVAGGPTEKGGIAMKFEVAYFRAHHVSPMPTREQAEDIYKQYASGARSSETDSTELSRINIFRFLVIRWDAHWKTFPGAHSRTAAGSAITSTSARATS